MLVDTAEEAASEGARQQSCVSSRASLSPRRKLLRLLLPRSWRWRVHLLLGECLLVLLIVKAVPLQLPLVFLLLLLLLLLLLPPLLLLLLLLMPSEVRTSTPRAQQRACYYRYSAPGAPQAPLI